MKIKTLSLAFAGILLASLIFTPMSNAKTTQIKNKVVCPLITLSSPPSTLKSGSLKICENTLTVSTVTCSPFTFNFTWTGGSYSKSTASGSAILKFNLPSLSAGTVVHLTIVDSGTNSSGNYDFTITSPC